MVYKFVCCLLFHQFIFFNCALGGSYCDEHIDPSDPSPSVGDKARTNFPGRGVQTGTITDIRTTKDDSNPTPPANQYDIIDVATGTVIEIVLDQPASSGN